MSRLNRGFCLEEDIQNIIDKLEELEEYPKRTTNSNGLAIKFADGTMICTKQLQITADVNIKWENSYITNKIDLGKYAETFTDIPTKSIVIKNYAGILSHIENFNSSENIAKIEILRPNVANGAIFIIDIIAIRQMEINI